MIGCIAYPADENNVLQVPDWYAFVGIGLATAVAVLCSRIQEAKSNCNNMSSDTPEVCVASPEDERPGMNDPAQMRSTDGNRAKDQELLRKIGIEPYISGLHLDSMDVIRAMEQRIDDFFLYFISKGISPDEGKNLFASFKFACETSSLPLAAEVRLESLLAEYEPKFTKEAHLFSIDHMTGHDFEHWCARLLKRLGFSDVQVTPGSGDQGVDILAEKDGIRYAIQCKCYSSNLGNTPIQEVYAGKSMYHCQVGAVMTNRYFTQSGKELAENTGVLLWDRDWIEDKLNSTAPPRKTTLDEIVADAERRKASGGSSNEADPVRSRTKDFPISLSREHCEER